MLDIFVTQFNLHAILVMSTAGAILSLGIYTLTKDKSSIANISFLLLCVSTAILLGSTGFSYILQYPEHILRIQRPLVMLGMITVTINVYFFTLSILDQLNKFRRSLWTVGFVGVIMYVWIQLSPNFILGLKPYLWGREPQFSWQISIFLVYFFSVTGYSFFLYWKALKRLPNGVERKRVKYIAIALLIAHLTVIDFLPSIGIGSYPFGYLTVLAMIVITTYTITRYKLMTVTVEVAGDTIISTMGDCLIVANSQMNIEFINKAASDLLGFSQSEIKHQPFESICDDTSSFEMANLKGENNIIFKDKDITMKAKNGEIIPFNATSSVLIDENNSTGTVIVAKDIRKTQSIIKELEQRTESLEKAKHELDEKIEELERFNKITAAREIKFNEVQQMLNFLESK